MFAFFFLRPSVSCVTRRYLDMQCRTTMTRKYMFNIKHIHLFRKGNIIGVMTLKTWRSLTYKKHKNTTEPKVLC